MEFFVVVALIGFLFVIGFLVGLLAPLASSIIAIVFLFLVIALISFSRKD